MTRDLHDELRELIALGKDLSDAQQRRLRDHLEQCTTCRDYAEATSWAVAALRSIPLAADSRLVRATQMRVRFHASRLRETRERMWLVGIACVGVGLFAAPTALLLWRLFAWMGERAEISTVVWQASFMIFCIAPALVVSAILLARGTHLKSKDEPSQPWR